MFKPSLSLVTWENKRDY